MHNLPQTSKCYCSRSYLSLKIFVANIQTKTLTEWCACAHEYMHAHIHIKKGEVYETPIKSSKLIKNCQQS